MGRFLMELASRLRAVGLMSLMLLLSGCVNVYVDTMTQDLKPEQIRKVESPKPVQLLFEFQTKGATNSRATEHVKGDVLTHVKDSGLFSEVSAEPVRGGGILSLIIENVPLTQDAASRGFVTGLTFGLAGNVVTDGYVCTVVYANDANPGKITAVAKHAIHTAIGAQSAPVNAVESPSIDEAVKKMVRQIVTNALNNLAANPNFK